MKKLVLIAVVTVFVWSCKEKKSESEPKNQILSEKTADDNANLEKGCYAYHESDNTIMFEIEKATNPVTGNLMYQLEGKDKNIGEFEGTLREDKLIGTYTFRSEGKKSSREVAFQVKKGQLIEGYGKLNEEGNAFKNYDDINFSSTMPLTKTVCDF